MMTQTEIDALPRELKELKQWLCYIEKPRENGKIGKPPASPITGKPISWTDPKNFLSFDQAVNALKANKPSNLSGIGIVFTGREPFSGVDIDSCIQGGIVSPDAAAIIERLNSYSEVSPSGTGLRIIGRGKLPDGDNGGKHGNYEAYSAKRFLTITGNLFESRKTLREFSSDLAWFRKTYAKKGDLDLSGVTPSRGHQETRQSSGPLSDSDIMAIIGKAKNSAKIQDLMSNQNKSEDLASLINRLVFYSKDTDQIERIIRTNCKIRDKWDEKRDKDNFLVYEIKRLLAGYKGGSYGPKAQPQEGGDISLPMDSIPIAPENPEEWPNPVWLDRPELPEIPKGKFPDWLENMIDAGAEATETPRALGVGLALFVLSTACQKIFSIRPEPGYFEQSCLYLLLIMDSSNRKTAVQLPFLLPLLQKQDELAKKAIEEVKQAERKRKSMGAIVDGLRRQLGTSKTGGKGKSRDDLMAEIEELESNMPTMPAVPTLLVNDITPERLPVLMEENGERIGLIADEGGIFETIAGRYSKGVPNLDIFLQGYPGSYVRIDRGSRPPITLYHPALSLCVFSQTEVLSGLGGKPGFRGRGLLGRFLYLIPPSNLGYRKLETTPFPESTKATYSKKITALLEKKPADSESGTRPHTLSFSTEAFQEWKEFSKDIESTMRPGGGLEMMTDYGGKVPGHAARIAGLLHCAKYADDNPESHLISGETMNHALEIMAVFLEHAKYGYGIVGANPGVEDAKRIIGWIERNNLSSFTARDAFEGLKGHFKTMEPLNEALDILGERYYIGIIPQEKRAGRPTKQFQVNPKTTGKRK